MFKPFTNSSRSSKLYLGFLSVLLFLCLWYVPDHANAGAAYSRTETVKQPDGVKFTIKNNGDEWTNWTEAETGDVVVKDPKGTWTYAKILGEEVKPSAQKFDPSKASKTYKPFSASLKRSEMVNRMIAKSAKNPNNVSRGNKPASSGPSGASSSTTPSMAPSFTGNVPLIAILVNYNDAKIKNSDKAWSDEFFSSSINSVNKFYEESSGGKMHFVPATESYGSANDGIISVSLNFTHPNPASTSAINQTITTYALNSADSYINFAPYDTNKDGIIQNNELCVVIIVAGYEQSYSSDLPHVWAHRWLLNGSQKWDGVIVSSSDGNAGYAQFGEIHYDHMAPIGIICHELGHMLGLPDLYDTTGATAGVGAHSIMSYGSWGHVGTEYAGTTPVHFDAWSKQKLGFVTPTLVSSSSTATLKSIATGQYNILKIPTSVPYEYFLLENREFELYDRALATYVDKPGIAIWHIDENRTNNNTPTDKWVDLLEANEGVIGYSEIDTKSNYYPSRPYYAVGNVTEANDNTKPSTRMISNYPYGIGISVKSAAGQSMDVALTVKTSDITPPTQPTNVTATSDGANGAVLNWSASTDNVGVSYYNIFDNFSPMASISSNSATLSNLTTGKTYLFTIQAVDAAGNSSPMSTGVTFTIGGTTPLPTTGPITIYYKPSFNATPYMHWRPAGGNWTNAPGIQMTNSNVAGYYSISVDPQGASSIEAAFNDGGSNWDSKNGANYVISSSTTESTVENGVIKSGKPAGTTSDTTAPSVPTNVVAASKTDKTITLTWTASTDNVAVTGYEVYRGNVKIGTSTTASYADSGLTANTAYSYTIKAYDAANNLSAASTALSVTTNPATSTTNSVTVYYKRTITTGTQYMHWRPVGGTWTTAPGLAMTASEVTGYAKATVNAGTQTTIEACFNVDGNNWDSKGGSNYMIPVGTQTIENSTIKVGTPVGVTVDTTAPSVPTNLTSPAQTDTTITLNWTASTDNSGGSGLKGYFVYWGPDKFTTTPINTTTFVVTGLTPNTGGNLFTVTAVDNAGNESAKSVEYYGTTKPSADTTAPSVPTNVVAASKTDKTINLTWTASTDNVAVTGYEVYRGNVKIGTSATASYADSGLTANTAYSYTIKAYDAAKNVSAASTALSVTTNPATSTTNTVTVYFKRTITTGTQYMHWRPVGGTWTTAPGLAMTASEVSGYAKVTVNAGTQTSIEACFNVDGNNWDSKGGSNYIIPTGTQTIENSTIKVGAPAGTTVDTTAPSVPTNLTSPAQTDTTITLNWTASTDNSGGSGLKGYYVYWGPDKFTATPINTTTFVVTGLNPNTGGNLFTVTAVDNAGNESAKSVEYYGTTKPSADTTAPSVPTNVVAASKTDKTINLTWTASTDNVAVTGYEVYRGNVKVGTSTTTSYADSGLTANTAYSYTIKAYDATNNLSAASTALSVTTNTATVTNNTVTVYYKRKITTGTQYMHWRPLNGTWSTAPGVVMTNDLNGYAKLTVTIGNATGIEACFNVNNANWDSNNGANYKTGIGDVTIENGVIKALKPY